NDIDGETVDCRLTEARVAFLFDGSNETIVVLVPVPVEVDQSTAELQPHPSTDPSGEAAHRGLPVVTVIPTFPKDVQLKGTNFRLHTRLLMCQLAKPIFEVTDVSTLHTDVINQDIALAVKQKHPDIITVNLAKNVTYNGFNYRIGMVVAHGSLAGLPEFCEIVHMIVLHKSLTFIIKKLAAWYLEHYRAYEVAISTAGKLRLVEAHELRDQYPLVHCMVDDIFQYSM
ncbi:hypothetical protein QTP86_019465, partial [Hemibagrus guttatus]